ncbi:GNAT family N-acetyltransferase [Foetidibacter luteolus]|uniref:GNAT family N-acetyltransferase n=1 Tax=Foetidibacter luteolus TaxID=2608880 RepID=UPI00129AEA71|nr:GNAT family N-acetyltransferase [Foetidibacter luteolus]
MGSATVEDDVLFTIAATAEDFEDGRLLFREYAASLGFDLCFQNFAEELLTLDKQYNKPDGALILARYKNTAVGCVAVRKLEEGIAELKRLYVQPGYRNLKLGKKLLEQSLRVAQQLGYKLIRLDSAPGQEQAQHLYRRYGFYEIPSYRHNPVPGVVYMEYRLK